MRYGRCILNVEIYDSVSQRKLEHAVVFVLVRTAATLHFWDATDVDIIFQYWSFPSCLHCAQRAQEIAVCQVVGSRSEDRLGQYLRAWVYFYSHNLTVRNSPKNGCRRLVDRPLRWWVLSFLLTATISLLSYPISRNGCIAVAYIAIDSGSIGYIPIQNFMPTIFGGKPSLQRRSRSEQLRRPDFAHPLNKETRFPIL